jgi:hypothetical protein
MDSVVLGMTLSPNVGPEFAHRIKEQTVSGYLQGSICSLLKSCLPAERPVEFTLTIQNDSDTVVSSSVPDVLVVCEMKGPFVSETIRDSVENGLCGYMKDFLKLVAAQELSFDIRVKFYN